MATMDGLPAERSILALTYSDGVAAAALLWRLSRRIAAGGGRCAGLLQTNEPAADGRSRCDMVLECLSSGQRIAISEKRGVHACGCRLDAGELMRALAIEKQALAARPDVLLVNKFGRSEGEGGGLRPLIAEALELAIPVVVMVPWRNIESWRIFAGDLAVEFGSETLSPDRAEDLLRQIGVRLRPVSVSALGSRCLDEGAGARP